MIAIGVTLTGHDELEPGASQTHQRIRLLKRSNELGFKTFASIEPIIDFDSSFRMICDSYLFCDLYKIGLKSGEKYSKQELIYFIEGVNGLCHKKAANIPVYFKDSLLKAAGIDRKDLPVNCVNRDFDLFKSI